MANPASAAARNPPSAPTAVCPAARSRVACSRHAAPRISSGVGRIQLCSTRGRAHAVPQGDEQRARQHWRQPDHPVARFHGARPSSTACSSRDTSATLAKYSGSSRSAAARG